MDFRAVFLLAVVPLAVANCGRQVFAGSRTGRLSHEFRVNNGEICSYKISVAPEDVIQLTFTSLSVKGSMPDCNGDGNGYAAVFVGCKYPRLLTKFCTSNAEHFHPIFSVDSCLIIKFKAPSDGFVGRSHFRASYASLDTSLSCPYIFKCSSTNQVIHRSPAGYIASNGWPYRHVVPSTLHCKSVIVTSSIHVKLTVMAFNLSYPAAATNSITLKAGHVSEWNYFRQVLRRGHQHPFSLLFEGGKAEIEYTSHEGSNYPIKSGFVIGYVSYSSGSKSSESLSGSALFGITVAVMTSLVLMSIMFCKSKSWMRARGAFIWAPREENLVDHCYANSVSESVHEESTPAGQRQEFSQSVWILSAPPNYHEVANGSPTTIPQHSPPTYEAALEMASSTPPQ